MKPCSFCGRVGCRVVAHSFAADPVNTKRAPVNTETGAVNTGRSVNADRHSPGYMREYMKVYRAVKAGRAEWLRA